MQATPLLSVQDVVVRHRSGRRGTPSVTAVRGVSLEVNAGEIHALVGESGSGKTSLARAVLCLQPIAEGRVCLHDVDLATLPRRMLRERRRHFQAVFQDPLAALSPRRTVLQALVEPLQRFRIGTPAEWPHRANSLLSRVGLDADLGSRYPHELSGGQRQRVCLARALAAEPELVVADEPVSSLDRATRQRILGLIRDLRDRLGVAFLLISHDLSDVRNVADRVSVMYGGTLVESGAAEVVFNQPAHPYSRCLLEAVPQADPNAPRPRVLAGEPPSVLTPPGGCVFHKRCPQAIAECSRIVPHLRPVPSDAGTHTARCHLCQD